MVFTQKRINAATLSLVIVAFLSGASSFVEAAVPLEAGDPNVFVRLSNKTVPSVVNISTITTVKNPYTPGSPDDVLRKFFGELFRQYQNRGGSEGPEGPGGDDDEDDGPTGPGPKAMSLGTGFIIDASGLILTNNHVVADADEIKITFTEALDEKPSDAEVVGRDLETDIALIKVKNKREMIPAVLGDSDTLEVGEYVIAVGNPFGQGHSVTHGIISAKGRQAPDFPLASYLQTDAPINPGNSGGPLVNLKGEVIGINNAIDQRAHGIGFAIPINLAKAILPQLRSKGVVSRGFIGVLVDSLTPDVAKKIGVSPDLEAPMVTHVVPGEAAAKAGIQPYDVILELNGKPIHSGTELIGAVTALSVGQSVPIKVSRSGRVKTLTLKIGQRPGTQPALKSKEEPSSKKKKQQTSSQTGMVLENITPGIAHDLGLNEKFKGVVVTDVVEDSPADQIGLQQGDVILEVDRKPVRNVQALLNLTKQKKSYLIRVRRMDPQGGETFQVLLLDLKESKSGSQKSGE